MSNIGIRRLKFEVKVKIIWRLNVKFDTRFCQFLFNN